MVRRLINLPFLAMTAWAATLGWLALDDNYQLFLAPRFSILIHAGLGLSLVFAASLAAAGSSRGRDHLLKGLILMLPILFIFASGNKTLGNFALSKRSMTPLEVNGPNNTDPTESRENLNPDTGEKNLPGTGSPLVSISDLVRQFNTYDGRRISVEGLFSNTVEGHDELSAVFRYFITCCAADAMPVGVFMAGQGAAGIEDNQWVRAAGRVSAREMDGYTVIYMDLEKLEKKEMPSKNAAYLF